MSKQIKSLSTGNASARKPGRGAVFAVTQESYDVAFGAGVSVGSAFNDAAAALRPLLYPLSARTEDRAVEQWNEYARAFAAGMAEARAIDPDSARRMFGRIVDFLGFEKPQTLKARALQVKRAAEAKAEGKGEAAEKTPKKGEAAAAVAAVQMGLSKIEAHLIKLIRAGKFEMAGECIAALAEKSAE